MSRSRTALIALLVVGAAAVPLAGPAAAADVTLTITVVDAEGDRVPNAELTGTWDGGSATETTRANGQALMDVPEGADVEITVDHPTYMRNTPFDVTDASTREVELPVALRGAATITVRDGAGPVRGAAIRLQDGAVRAASVRTGADGVAASGPVEHGSYALIVSKPGYFEHSETVSVGNDTALNVTLQRGTAPVTFDVVDDHYDEPEPVENATVRVEPLGTTLPTLAEGRAQTSLPVNTDYEVTVSKAGYDSVTTSLRLGESARNVSVRINRRPAINVTVANRQVVVGETTRVTVIDEYGDPVEGASIAVGDAAVGETGADGTLEVPVDSAGTATIQASTDGLTAEASVEGVEPAGTSTPTPAPPSPTPTATAGGGGPGVGPVGALLALVLGTALLARRRR